MRKRKLLTGVGLAAAVALVVGLALATINSCAAGEQAQPVATPPNYTAPASPLPLTVTSSFAAVPSTDPSVSSQPAATSASSAATASSANPGSSVLPSAPGTNTSPAAAPSKAPKPVVTADSSATASAKQNAVSSLEAVPVPASKSLSIYLRTKQIGIIPAPDPRQAASCGKVSVPEPLGTMSAESGSTITPPELSGCNWSGTSVWIEQSVFPSYPSVGTSYVYGHACRNHLCPFTAIRCTSQCGSGGTPTFTVNPGDQVVIGTASGTLTYQVTRVGESSKNASSLAAWASDVTVPNRLVLVTCEFEDSDSLYNIVVVANLVAATKS